MKTPSPIVKSGWFGSSDFGCSNQSGPMGHMEVKYIFCSLRLRRLSGSFWHQGRDQLGPLGCHRCGDQLFHLSDIIKRQFPGGHHHKNAGLLPCMGDRGQFDGTRGLS